ncbi:MAG: PEP-CTERM sorting domain-containing protein [Deltaproteobacteria bacterium]|nr:PEP-CTERM sorting domain-containing protein [Deltaproteobacteria bacterium]
MKKLLLLIAGAILFMDAATADALPITNVALNKSVTLNGSFFSGGWGGGRVVNKQTVVDGVFLPRSNQWDRGPVWWDSHRVSGQNIQINLGKLYEISSFIVQVDDNDAYILEYWNTKTNAWKIAWNIPNYDWVGGRNLWGMQTRPNIYNNTARYTLTSAITTDKLRISGNMRSSDRFFAVSEVQAFGRAAQVPEPAAILLLGAGMAGLAALRKRI